ncbi:MAG: DUF6265 family protein [Crocinitomicaceae bacterium]|nr:DUF6265 family protein [Crocinitomicaceae bacterium]
MKQFNLLILPFSVLFLIGCNNSSNEPLVEEDLEEKESYNVDWLTGLWMNSDQDGTLFEEWTKENDSTFMGKSYYINLEDTLFVENIRLTINADSLYYESIKHDTMQKNKLFKGLLVANNSFKIENPQHGFPKNIIYNQLNDTLMMIEISGVIDGQKETQPYNMVKINPIHE